MRPVCPECGGYGWTVLDGQVISCTCKAAGEPDGWESDGRGSASTVALIIAVLLLVAIVTGLSWWLS